MSPPDTLLSSLGEGELTPMADCLYDSGDEKIGRETVACAMSSLLTEAPTLLT